jgi:phenylalanyl-tRNA synthetase alpha chain
MQEQELQRHLHPLEVKVLRHFKDGRPVTVKAIEDELGLNLGQANQAISWLSAKDFLREESRTKETVYELTDLGGRYAAEGTPEERMIATVRSEGPHTMPELARKLGLEQKDIGSAFGRLSKEGVLAMEEGKRVASRDGTSPSVQALRAVLDRAETAGEIAESSLSAEEQQAVAAVSKKRGAASTVFKVSDREEVTHRLTQAGIDAAAQLEASGVTGEEVGKLSPEMLQDGSWRNVTFRPYNVNSPPSRVLMGRRNPYTEYLDTVKDKLTSLGFEEFDGPLVETEFWNSDALFMPQFHAARDIHDVFHIDRPTHAERIEEPYVSRVAAAHEDGWETGSRGWNYGFDRDFTRRLILRSQGTVLSAKTLPRAKVPGKYFGIVRCFRNDQVDATHLAEFYQTEGIVLGEEVNLRTLLGFLEMFAEELAGATDIKYVPGYFPFTEPSVEVHIKHPVLGWFELGGSGIFRPEVTEPLGVHVPVLAWGLGIDRMALMHLGLDDLRELFSTDIERVRLRRRN